jgi:ABC-type dipeptide/oligopeptide/nickel transport system ATPase component
MKPLSHARSVAACICAAANSGRVVEHGPTKQVLQHPQHGYTIQLLDAVANPFVASRGAIGGSSPRANTASAGSPASGRGK